MAGVHTSRSLHVGPADVSCERSLAFETFYFIYLLSNFFIFQELGRARRSCKTGKGTLWLQVCIADL